MTDNWIETWLSTPRFSRYLDTCGGDRNRAFELYSWNLDISQSLMRDIAVLEVALRNSYDQAISSYWDGKRHWLIDYESPFLQTIMSIHRGNLVDQSYLVRRDILHAVDRAGGANADPGKIVAELTLGFWTRLTETRFEKTYWVPYLNHAYPKATRRGEIHADLTNIRMVRNRIAYHEPVFDYQA